MSKFNKLRNPSASFEVPPHSQHSATVFFLHGLGGSGEGWLPVAQELGKRSGLENVKWLLPNAPRRAITANFGQEMPGWYDVLRIDSSSCPRPEDAEGLFSSVARIHALLDEEVGRGMASERIVLAGFSQGAAVSLAAGLTYGKRLAGVVALSGYLMCPGRMEEEKSSHTPELPLFIAHGKDDQVVNIGRSEASVRTLKARFGYEDVTEAEKNGRLTVTYYEGLGHEARDDELQNLGEWLERLLRLPAADD